MPRPPSDPRLCTRCGTHQPLTAFGKNAKMADGYLQQCRACRREWCREYRAANRVSVRSQQRAWEQRPEVRERAGARLSKWRDAHPERRAAQVAVNNAVRDGRLCKQPCWVCGSDAAAHHPDYSRPLDVVWLCHSHHRATHLLVTS
jgi:hypothetical protein